MPELPDVEIFRRRLDHTATGRRITDVKVKDARLLDGVSARELERRLVGRRIRSTERHGKHLIAGLDDGSALILHFGMTGTIETSAEDAAAPRYEVLHIGLGKDRWASVTSRRKLGHIWLTSDVATFLKDHSQGPDALAKPLDADAFGTALVAKRSVLKTALMDQARIAGIGNIYADEILFQARLHPLTQVGDLERDQLERLYRTTIWVLLQAIARSVMAEGPASAFPDDWLSAHREPGGRCPRCRALLATIKTGGRTGYFCSRCQPRPAARR
jgi:formamidopyrimidine-DNA glycosylase